jgi:hypothetical protein
MRPRHHTAENYTGKALLLAILKASMRPRHHTAENAAQLGVASGFGKLQ